MKLCIFCFLLSVLSQVAFSQHSHDTAQYVLYKDKFGKEQKAPIVKAHQILIVDGDKMFFVPDEATLNTLLHVNQKFDIIHNPDSLKEFFHKHIKAVIVIKDKEK